MKQVPAFQEPACITLEPSPASSVQCVPVRRLN